MRIVLLLLLLTWPGLALTVSDDEARDAGRRIWQNECGGRVDGLTSWNQGEDFPSLGIGHFIWYPTGRRGPFEESFPGLVTYLESQGTKLPAWLREAKSCPWDSRSAFLADFEGERLTGLRKLLSSTVAQQARYVANRLEAALPKMLESIPESERPTVKRRFERVAAAPGGLYALLDYVNFKGEGVKPTERYKGQGWGMLQVLQDMRGEAKPTREFAAAADRMLTRRVQNSPPERNEAKWLTGWRNRVAGYAR